MLASTTNHPFSHEVKSETTQITHILYPFVFIFNYFEQICFQCVFTSVRIHCTAKSDIALIAAPATKGMR